MASVKGQPQLELAEVISIGGFALFVAWHFSVILWIAPSYTANDPIASCLALQITYLLGTALATILFSHMRFSLKFRFLSKPFVRAAGSALDCLPALMLGFGIGIDTQSGYLVFLLLMFLVGIDTAGIFGIWEDVSLRLGMKSLTKFVAGSFLLGTLLFIALRFFFPDACAVLTASCLLGMTLLHYTVDHYFPADEEDNTRIEEDERGETPMPEATQPQGTALIANSLLFAVGMGFGFGFGLISAINIQLVLIPLACGLVLCLLLLTHSEYVSYRISIERVEMLCAVAIICSLTIMIAGRSTTAMLIGNCAIIATWLVYRTLSGGLLIRFAILNSCPSTRFLAASKISINCGILVGWGIICILSATGMDETTLITCTALVIIVVAVFVFLRFAPHSPEDPNSPITPLSTNLQAFMAKCMKVADLYQLSPREGEILCYLARGRNAKHIAEELIISEHTVKSHIYRIYKKMNIHTRQGLIDLVETSFPDEEVAISTDAHAL